MGRCIRCFFFAMQKTHSTWCSPQTLFILRSIGIMAERRQRIFFINSSRIQSSLIGFSPSWYGVQSCTHELITPYHSFHTSIITVYFYNIWPLIYIICIWIKLNWLEWQNRNQLTLGSTESDYHLPTFNLLDHEIKQVSLCFVVQCVPELKSTQSPLWKIIVNY